MIKESEEMALLQEKNARLRAQFAIATAGHASAVQTAGASDRDPFDAQVADQKTLFSDFIEHLPIGLCLVGRGGKVLTSNPAYRHFLPDGSVPSLLAPRKDLPQSLGYGNGMTCWRRLREHDQVD